MRTRQAPASHSLPKKSAPPTGSEGFFPSLAQHQTLEESAYQDLRHAIVEGRFAPGERIVAATVAAAAGISRIPVMQALRRLEADGFVRITPHKDVVVLGWAPGEIRERFLLMAALEVLCLREAEGKITRRSGRGFGPSRRRWSRRGRRKM
jgi:DNA-binding GntR family transcriptional regulator